jgi:hypothetical protein
MNGKRLLLGFWWGLLGTLAMSVPMVVGFTTGVAPMPEPIPLAIAGQVLGDGTPRPLLMAAAAVSHLAYGGAWGAVLAALTEPVTVWKGLALGVALWALMGVVALPLVGWGLFGAAVTPAIAAATLTLHLVYGAVLGWVADQGHATAAAHG